MLTRTVLAVLCFLGTSGFAQNGKQPAADPGFVEGVFNENSINAMLGRKNCDGIRFYTAMLDGAIHVIASPTEKQADMGSAFLLFKPYFAAMGVNTTEIVVVKLKEDETKEACKRADESQYAHYSTHFTKKDIQVLLLQDNCNALKIIPTKNSDPLSMEVHAASFVDGNVADLGQGSGFDLITTDPCPPVCGPAANYIYMPK